MNFTIRVRFLGIKVLLRLARRKNALSIRWSQKKGATRCKDEGAKFHTAEMHSPQTHSNKILNRVTPNWKGADALMYYHIYKSYKEKSLLSISFIDSILCSDF